MAQTAVCKPQPKPTIHMNRLLHEEPTPALEINSLRFATALAIEVFERVHALKRADSMPSITESGRACARHLSDDFTRGVSGIHILTRHAPPVLIAHALLLRSGLSLEEFVASTGKAIQLCYQKLGLASMLIANSESHIHQVVAVESMLARLTWLPEGSTVVVEHRLLAESELQRLRAISVSKRLAVTLISSQERPALGD